MADDWQRWLRPEDERYVRTVDPMTGYLYLRLVTATRAAFAGMFPELTTSAQRSAEGAPIDEEQT